MTRDRNFYKTLLLIGLPVAFQSLITLGVVFLDNIMVGWIPVDTDTAIAAVAQANIMTTMFTFFVKGLSGGASLLISQYWGKKDLQRIKSVFSIIIIIGVTMAVIITTAVFLFPQHVMRLFTNEETVIVEGAKYISIICFTYILFTISDVLVSMLRCVEIVKITLYISITSLFVNLFLNYSLIFGNFGFPALGIRGAAIATLITRAIECALVLTYTFCIQKRIDYKLSDLLKSEKVIWLDYFKYGLPIVLGDIQWGFVGVMKAGMIGRMGKTMMTANNITEVILSLAGIFTTGLGSAACVIIGKTIGEKDYQKTRQYSKTLQILFFAFGLVMCTIIFFIRGSLVMLYREVSPDVKGLAAAMIGIGAVTLVGTFYHATCFTGINRGAGDSKFVFKIDMLCGWLVVLPLTYLSGLVLHWPLPVVFLCTRFDQTFKWIIAWFRLRGDKWIRNVTRD